MYDNQSQENLREAASGIKPYGFFLTNYDGTNVFQDVVHEMEHILDEYPHDFELGKLKYKDNLELYKHLN